MSGAESGLDAIWRARSSSVISSILLQSVAASATRAALLKPFAIALHLSLVRLAERDHPSLRFPVSVNTNKKTIIDEAERHLANLAIFKAIISHRQMRSRKQDLGNCEGNTMLRPVGPILRGVVEIPHVTSYTPLAYNPQETLSVLSCYQSVTRKSAHRCRPWPATRQ